MRQTETVERMDLRGVRCPLNWARARVRLEEMARESVLELLVDDPRAVRDIPRAAEACGYVVSHIEPAAGCWRIRIVK